MTRESLINWVQMTQCNLKLMTKVMMTAHTPLSGEDWKPSKHHLSAMLSSPSSFCSSSSSVSQLTSLSSSSEDSAMPQDESL